MEEFSQNKKPAYALTTAAIISAAAYVGVQMISDLGSLQFVSVFGKALDGGTFIYPFSFTLRDVCQKVLGKRGVKVLIWTTAAINVLMAVSFWFISIFPINFSAGGSKEWAEVLIPVWRITIASIIAEVFSELVDTEVYSWWVEKITTKKQWARVLVSNICSVPLDSFIFAFAAFYGTMPETSVWQIFMGNVVIKLIVTLISLPMIYIVKDSYLQPDFQKHDK